MFEIILFILLCALIVIVNDIKLSDFVLLKKENAHLSSDNIRQIKRAALVNKKKTFLSRQKEGMLQVLSESTMDMSFEQFKRVTFISGLVGVVVGLIFKNPFLSIILGVICIYVPVQFLKYQEYRLKKKTNDNLPFVTSVVTTSYMESENLKLAVEQNMDRMAEPFRTIFRSFYKQSRYISSNLKESIETMKGKIDNHEWEDWCNVLMDCEDDRQYKHLLPAIVQKMSDDRLMQRKADIEMESTIRVYLNVCLILIAIIPTFKFMLTDVYIQLVTTTIGKFCIAALFALMFYGGVKIMNLRKLVNKAK